MDATYVFGTEFTVSGNQESIFVQGRRVKADCGVDGFVYGTVASAAYVDPSTTVTISESVLTANLASVQYGVINPGSTGSLPDHASEHVSGGRDEITGLSDAVDKKHTQGSDTTLGSMTADVNMNTHKLTGLAVPASAGDSLRATAKLTEAALEDAVDHKDVATGNPHSVSKSDVGLGNVTNDAQIAKSIGTAKGDVIVFSASGIPIRVGVGTDNYVLTADAAETSGVKWAAASGGGGGLTEALLLG